MLKATSLALLILCGTALAAGQQATEAREAPRERYPFFTDAESRIILDYFRPGSGHPIPEPKLEGRAPAMPSKPLARGVILTEAVEKSAEDFPPELDRRLNSLPSGYRRTRLGAVALLVQNTTRLIVDTLPLPKR